MLNLPYPSQVQGKKVPKTLAERPIWHKHGVSKERKSGPHPQVLRMYTVHIANVEYMQTLIRVLRSILIFAVKFYGR